MSMEQIYEYGSRAGVWRLLRLFDRYQVPVTVFGVALATVSLPTVARLVPGVVGDEQSVVRDTFATGLLATYVFGSMTEVAAGGVVQQPGACGGGVEDVVMRILAAGEPIPLDKLGESAADPRYLHTVRGVGYKLASPDKDP